jgi:hypothetical protein
MKKIIAIPAGISALLLFPAVVLADEIPINITPPPTLKTTDLGKLVSGALGIILVIAVLATFVFLIIAGLRWITSGGDKAAVETAQKQIQAAILGLFIVFAAWALMLIVEQFFGISILRGIKLPTGY